nr:uncharacterized protein LOC118878603 isoform X3 [Drosophila suzukii]
MTPSSNILSISSSTTFCFAGDIGYGRSLNTRAPSISSMECLSMLVTPRPSLSKKGSRIRVPPLPGPHLPDRHSAPSGWHGFPPLPWRVSSPASPRRLELVRRLARSRLRSTPFVPGSSKRPMMDRSSPEAVRTTEKCGWTVTPSASTSSRQPLPSTLTLAPVSNKPVSCLPKVSTSAKGRGSAESMRLTAATTSRRLDLLILKRSLAFWTLRETRRMPLS